MLNNFIKRAIFGPFFLCKKCLNKNHKLFNINPQTNEFYCLRCAKTGVVYSREEFIFLEEEVFPFHPNFQYNSHVIYTAVRALKMEKDIKLYFVKEAEYLIYVDALMYYFSRYEYSYMYAETNEKVFYLTKHYDYIIINFIPSLQVYKNLKNKASKVVIIYAL